MVDPVDNTPVDDDDDEDEGEEGSEVEGIDPPPEASAPKPAFENEMLHRVVMELVEIKTSLAVLHHKLDQTLSGRIFRWLRERG